ncbi:MAG: hypothetical protein QG586_387 [Pseudomonadota bacterium]|nr:hypothetical protein [Pseudomonadota bacterium]MDQ1344857.1 hypothetical protein [Pseudomonadota bacterium]
MTAVEFAKLSAAVVEARRSGMLAEFWSEYRHQRDHWGMSVAEAIRCALYDWDLL